MQTHTLPYPWEFLFRMVLDVREYPHYVPGCHALTVCQEGSDSLRALMKTRYGMSFYSTVHWEKNRIFICGDFFQAQWGFYPVDEGTEISFFCEISLGWKILREIVASLTPNILKAFIQRAHVLYNNERAREDLNS